ncbi:MAG: putative sugar O-methyltransferase [Candidatus Limnocylindrales bacterium]
MSTPSDNQRNGPIRPPTEGAGQPAAPGSAKGGADEFWRQLGEKHRRDLDAYGFEAIKRNQAFRYFTWRWSWASIGRSEQMRFLLRHTSLLALLRCALTPADLSDRAWENVRWPSSGKGSDTDSAEPPDAVPAEESGGHAWPRRDRWLYAFAVRLLWLYAEGHDPLRVTTLPEPSLGWPLPITWRGRLISQDLANTALEAAAIGRALAGRQPGSILELGAGYGRTAYALMSLFPEATYTIVDIEPAISISRWYLSELFPPERLRFLSPEEAADLPDGSIDLALTISSLQEMTPAHVAAYLEMFDRTAEGGLVYLKQWRAWRNPVDQVELAFERYPIPARWALLFKERAPVQTSFIQAAWAIPT